MRLTILAAMAATSMLACTETPDVESTTLESTICLGDTPATAPLPTLQQYKPGTTVLPVSTVRQTWLLLPWNYHYDANQNVVVDTWGLFQVDTDVDKVLWGATVNPQDLASASVAWSLRAGNHGSFGRPPTPVGWPAGSGWVTAGRLNTIASRLADITTGLN